MQRTLVPEIDPASLQYAISGGSYTRGVEYLRMVSPLYFRTPRNLRSNARVT